MAHKIKYINGKPYHRMSNGKWMKGKYHHGYSRGVPKNFRHVWKYKGVWDETKVRPGLWKFNFKATKGKTSRSMGSFGVGTKGAWKIKGVQYIKKTGMGRYQTRLVGTKKPLDFYVKKKKKY